LSAYWNNQFLQVSNVAAGHKNTLQKGVTAMFSSLIAVYCILNLLLSEETSASSFDDLGKLLMGGVFAAVAVAVAFTLVRLRLRDKKPPSTSFISISSVPEKD
jgi:hypothetical protein